jgi:hypothetical protein
MQEAKIVSFQRNGGDRDRYRDRDDDRGRRRSPSPRSKNFKIHILKFQFCPISHFSSPEREGDPFPLPVHRSVLVRDPRRLKGEGKMTAGHLLPLRQEALLAALKDLCVSRFIFVFALRKEN